MMKAPEAGERLLHESSGVDGSFFVRPRPGDHANEHVLTVLYHGQPTHHVLSQAADGTILLSKKPTG